MGKRLFRHITLIAAACCLLAGRAADTDRFVLVIDAGHGGKDAGAVGSCSYEKNINLNVALAFGRLVERNCPDVRVIYTRKTDVFIPLGDRANIANKAKADLFISIHTNSVEGNRSAYGVETYTLCMEKMTTNLEFAKRENSVITYESDYKTRYEGFDPNKAESYVIFEFMQNQFMRQSVELARCIQQQYKRAGRHDKGVKQANLLVLRNTTMPAVLTELGFITNAEEERFLNSQEGIRTLATSIYNGFLAYRRQHGAKNLPAPITVEREAKAATTEKTVAEEPAVVPIETRLPDKQQPAAAKTHKETAPAEKPATKPAAPKAAKPTEKPAPKPAETTQQGEEGTLWRIQFAATAGKADPNDKKFKGIRDIRTVQEGKLYKHYTGSFRTQAEARTALAKVRETHPDAFIVKFVDGKRQ
ncbi:MAG: N-acetylmuramoyl-L-alanine amidase [Alloprevotella sp.]|nr:N-acetylmuramoyl-L-alanine amidase [Alloprevotella sp.]